LLNRTPCPLTSRIAAFNAAINAARGEPGTPDIGETFLRY
jgi:hypothetical protein